MTITKNQFSPLKLSGGVIQTKGSWNVNLLDSQKITFGAGVDLEIYSDGDDAIFRNLTQDKDTIHYVNAGGVDTESFRVEGATGNVVVNEILRIEKSSNSDGLIVENDGFASGIFNQMWSNTVGNAPYIKLQRSAGSKATPLAVLSGYEIGNFRFFSNYDNTNFTRTAELKVLATENHSATNKGIKWAVSGTPTGSATKADWITLLNGNLGINNDTPAEKVDIKNGNFAFDMDGAGAAARGTVWATGNAQKAQFQFFRHHGSRATPEAVEINNQLGGFGFYGNYDDTNTSQQAQILIAATENWDASNKGTNIVIQCTPTGSATRGTCMTLEDDMVAIGSHTPTISLDVKAKSGMSLIGGFCIKLTNKTGSNTVQGQFIRADTATDDAVILTAADETECFGVFLESGIADGAEAWVVVSGIADVAMADNTAATRGNWVETSSEAGYADATNASPAAAPTHFREIGHCIETVSAGGGGTHILARCVLHFN